MIKFTNYQGFGIDVIGTKRVSLAMHYKVDGYAFIKTKKVRIGFISIFYTTSKAA